MTQSANYVDFQAVKKSVSILQILEHYHLADNFKRGGNGDSLTGACPLHKGENPTHFRVSLSKNCWNCFGKCKRGGNILDFVSRMEDCSIREAALRISEWFRLSGGQSPEQERKPSQKEAHRTSKRQTNSGISEILDENAPNKPLGFELQHLDQEHPYFAERGLTHDTVLAFGLGYCGKGSMAGRIVIPIHNVKGDLVAYAVSEEVWTQCNQILGTITRPRQQPAKRAVHLFAGFVFCGCGEKMYVPVNSPKYICSACRNKIPAADLEDIFFEQLHGFLISPTEVNAYLARAADTLTDKERLLESRKKEAEKVRQETDRTYRLYLDKQLTSEAFGKFFKPLEERQKQIDEEIPRIQAEIDFLRIESFSSDQVMNDAHDLQARWPTLERDEKRKIVECITKKIVIAKDEISIDLCYLPSSKELSKRNWSLGGSNP